MSRLPLELLLSLRYLRPRRTFVSIITFISVLSVMLAVTVLIVVISVMTGFDRELREKVLGFNTHLRISNRDGALQDYALLMDTVKSNRNVRGVSPFVLGPVFLEVKEENGSRFHVPWVRGIDPQTESSVSVLPKSIVWGDFDVSGRGILIGREFARNMGLTVGDKVSITSPRDVDRMRKAQEAGREIAIVPDDFEVKGVFDVGYFEYNASVIVTSLENAQEFYDLNDSVHGLFVMLHDPYRVNQVRDEFERVFGDKFQARTWIEENANLFSSLVVEKNVMFITLLFIMIVAALCMTSTLIIRVVQKTREIGMLKALGTSRLQIMAIFLSQSAIVGVLGVTSGFGLGMLLLRFRNEFLHFLRRAFGFEIFPAAIYGFHELPALIVPGDIMLICGTALLLCILSGVIPAWTAARLKPVEALRYE
jgi:lipoprotein-releasing system permease protein